MNSNNSGVERAGPADDPPPRRPAEPDAADCCGEGCVRCVYDVYEDALERYEEALAAWRDRHP
ncbi:MAG TPA: oxidoreductase-like domain-containing protein [Rhodanobacter sp.]